MEVRPNARESGRFGQPWWCPLPALGGAVTQNNKLWWKGSECLSKPKEWLENIRVKATKESLAGARKVRELFQLATEQEPHAFSGLISRRNYWTVRRTCVWIARYVLNVTNKVKKNGPISTEEIETQKRFWEERTQDKAKRARSTKLTEFNSTYGETSRGY